LQGNPLGVTKNMAKLLVKKAAARVGDIAVHKSNRVVVDFPRESSTISGPYYSVRIGALEADTVDVCINQGDWLTCRHAAGYWWYDWADFEPGEYQIVARARIGGQTNVSKARTLMVK